MALRLSTGFRNALLSKKGEATNLVTGTTISFGDGTGTDGRDQILDSGDGLGDFVKRSQITVSGSGSGTNDGTFEILSVADGAIEVVADSFATESATEQIILASAEGGSVSDLFRNGVICIFTGSQPASANLTETGFTKLVTITIGSGAFVAGAPGNGINLDVSTAGVLAKDADEVWSGSGLADGTAGWFRFYANPYTTGQDETTAVRFDGSCATSGAQLNLSSTAVTTGGTTTVDSVAMTFPAS